LMQEEDLERWRQGVRLEDGMTLPAEVRLLRHEGDKSWIEVTLREGRNQQIRRMGEATRFVVMRLARVSFAGVSHEGLRPGSWRQLTVDELNAIKKQFGVPKRVRRPEAPRLAPTNERRERRPRPEVASPNVTPGRKAAPKFERSGRSGTTPRGAAKPGPRARGRAGR
jgi:23S rRNA pseudouridine2605 synthase